MSGILTQTYSAFPIRNSDEEKYPNWQKTSSDAGGTDAGVIYCY
jgi:hypothetical protein